MSLLVVGSMAFDSVKTPFGERDNAIGGSATYFSVSASYFTDVRLVAVVGQDFPENELNFLAERSVDLAGLEELRTYLDGFWDDVLQAFKAEADAAGAREEEDDVDEQR